MEHDEGASAQVDDESGTEEAGTSLEVVMSESDITRDLVDVLSNNRDLNLIDLQAIEAYAGQLFRMRVARALLRVDGIIIEGLRGPMTHPAVAIEKEASAEMRQWITRRPDLFAPPEEGETVDADPDTGPGTGTGDVLSGL